MPRPRGEDWLEDEIRAFKEMGVDTIVSFLTPWEESALGLKFEKYLCKENDIEFLSFPIEDYSVPDSVSEALQFFSKLYESLRQYKSIALHCRAGIGRSGLAAASLLVKSGMSAESAFKLVSEARGLNVPDTREQREWVMNSGV